MTAITGTRLWDRQWSPLMKWTRVLRQCHNWSIVTFLKWRRSPIWPTVIWGSLLAGIISLGRVIMIRVMGEGIGSNIPTTTPKNQPSSHHRTRWKEWPKSRAPSTLTSNRADPSLEVNPSEWETSSSQKERSTLLKRNSPSFRVRSRLIGCRGTRGKTIRVLLILGGRCFSEWMLCSRLIRRGNPFKRCSINFSGKKLPALYSWMNLVF